MIELNKNYNENNLVTLKRMPDNFEERTKKALEEKREEAERQTLFGESEIAFNAELFTVLRKWEQGCIDFGLDKDTIETKLLDLIDRATTDIDLCR